MFSLSPPLILASGSPRRRQILDMLGIAFTVEASDADETPVAGMPAQEIPQELAERKALAVSRLRPGALILGADTLVELEGEILGKPADPDEALSMLRRLNGQTHRVFTGVALARDGVVVSSATGRSAVIFARRDDAELQVYAQSGEPLDKAGSYAIQGQGAFLVEKIDGCFFNVMGLPVQETLRLLAPFTKVVAPRPGA